MKSQRAKNAVRRLLMSIFFLECIGMTSVYSQVHEAIKPYVDFLSHKQLSAKDYILSLFKNHDIVLSANATIGILPNTNYIWIYCATRISRIM